MEIRMQGRVVTLRCRTCSRAFVPNVNQVKREQIIVCPHCKASYVPSGAVRESNAEPSAVRTRQA